MQTKADRTALKKLLTRAYVESCNLNLKAYNAVTQISLWCILQIIAAISVNFTLSNSYVVVEESSFQD
jgi:hypothetical protein